MAQKTLAAPPLGWSFWSFNVLILELDASSLLLVRKTPVWCMNKVVFRNCAVFRN